jgi:hypothetical protein
MSLETILKEAVKDGVSATIAAEIQDIVATETRRALRAHEDELTAMVRSVVGAAIAEMLNGKN